MEHKISTPKLKRIFNRLTEIRGKCRTNGQRYKVDKVLKPLREELIRRERNAEKKNYTSPRQLPRTCSSQIDYIRMLEKEKENE